MYRRKIRTILAAVLISIIFGAVSVGAAGWPEEKVEWTIVSGPEGSFGYATTTVLAKLLTDAIPNFTAYPQAGGTVKGMRQMSRGALMMSYGNTAAVEQLYMDKGVFEKQPIKKLRPQMGLPILPFTFFMVTKKTSGISTMDELAGKSISVSTPSYGLFTPAYEVMKALGIWDKVKHKDVSFSDYAGAISGDVVDAIMIYVISDATTSGAIRNLEARIDMRPVTFTEEQIKKIRSLPGIGFRQTKNIFPEIDEEKIGGWTYSYGWYFSPQAQEDLVYQIIKTCYEKREQLAKDSIGFIPWKNNPHALLRDAFSMTPHVTHHAGASKFFEELGLD